MLAGVYQSMAILSVMVVYYATDMWLTRRYVSLRAPSCGGNKNWGKTILLIIPAGFIVVQPLVWPKLSLHIDTWWGTLVQALGIMVTIGALLLNWWARLHLRQFYAEWPEVQPGHRIIDSGPYTHIRHPLFAAYILMTIGWLLINPALPSLLVVIYAFLDFTLAAKREEKLLSTEMPDYADYMTHTPRFFPKLNRHSNSQPAVIPEERIHHQVIYEQANPRSQTDKH
jgi:protein-S-isoprenylcysteine O-methyltransferase Ste14